MMIRDNFQNTATTHQSGFTLVEILLAMTIMSLVMVSIFNIVQVGLTTFEKGSQSMEDYQVGRIALREVSEELRFALSPKAFWRPNDSIEMVALDQLQTRFARQMIQEEDPGAITFMGSSDNVLFVRKRLRPYQTPPYDLQECRIYVDRNDNLVLEVERSLMMVKQATWFFQALFEVNVNGIIVPHAGPNGGTMRLREIGPHGEPPLPQFIGNYGMIHQRYLLAEGIQKIEFQYTDGSGGWQESWNSQEMIPLTRISPQSAGFNPVQDIMYVEKGPPRVVTIAVTLRNGDHLVTSADIPAGNMHRTDGGFYGSGLNMAGGSSGQGNNQQNQRPQNETPTGAPAAGI